MKKLALLAAILLLFGLTAGFAEVGVDISGDASATFGYNLESEAAGFDNDAGVDVIFTFVEEQSMDSGTMDGWYGWIELADFSVIYDNDDDSDYYQQGFYWDDDNDDGAVDFNVDEFQTQTQILVTEPDVTAKITNGTIYIVLYEAPDFDPDHVDAVEDDEDGDYDAEDDESDYVAPDLSENGGITIGYDAEAFDVEVYVGSGTGYGDADTNDEWLFGANVAVSAAGFDVSVDVVMASGVVADDDDIAFGADVGYTLDAGMVSVVPYAGVDYWMSDAIDPGIYEVGAGADLTFTNEDTFGVAFYMSDIDEDLDFEVTFEEDGEAGFVPGLAVELFFGGYDTFDDYRLAADLSYMYSDFKPFAGFGMDSANGASVYDASAGVEWSGIPNTVVTVEWSTDDLENHSGTIEVGAEVSM